VVLRVAIWMIVGACGYAAMIAIVKRLSIDLDVYVVVFWRYFLALVVMLPWLIPKGGDCFQRYNLYRLT
jgi:hypothetical protein